MRSMIFRVDEHVTFFDATERSLEEGLTVHCLAHDQLGPASGETTIVISSGQRPINQHPQHHTGGLAPKLDVKDLQAERLSYTTGKGTHLIDNARRRHLLAPKQKKWAYAHFGPTPKGPN